MKQKTLRRRILSGLLAALMIAALAPAALAADLCLDGLPHNVVNWEILKEANCHEKGARRGQCTKCQNFIYEDIPLNDNNHDAVCTDAGDGFHTGTCTYHNPARDFREPHTFDENGRCTKCLAVNYAQAQLVLPENPVVCVSQGSANASISLNGAQVSIGLADRTSDYNLTYNWYYQGASVGTGESYLLPSSISATKGDYSYLCVVIAVPKNDPTAQSISGSCTLTVRVGDLVTAYLTVGSSEAYMDFSETNSRTPMSVEEQIYEAVYNLTNGKPSYVIFDEPPATKLGKLNLVPNRAYYFYQNNNLSGVTFTPAGDGSTGSFTVSFTAYDDAKRSFPGVLTVTADKYAGDMDVLYTTGKGESVALTVEAFEEFWLNAYPRGELTRVTFTRLPAAAEGSLLIRYSAANRTGTRVKSGDYFFTAPSRTRFGLDEVAFVPNDTFTGFVAVPFEADGSNDRDIKTVLTGTMYILVSSGQVADVSCRVDAGGSCVLDASAFLSVFQTITGSTGSGFYIQLLDVPASGTLYVGSAGSGRDTRLTASNIGSWPFYYSSAWGDLIDDLTYFPGLEKTDTVRYVAYDTQGRLLYAGRIVFTVEDRTIPYECTSAGVAFRSSDFEKLMEAGKLSNVSFTPPAVSAGTLYYDRTVASAGTAITSEGPRYFVTAPNGAANVLILDKIFFLPAPGFSGTVEIPFTAYDTGTGKITGTVRVSVTATTTPTNPTNPTNPTDPTNPANPTVPTITFSDVPNTSSTAWYYTPVMDLVASGVISGFEDGTFRPNDAVTYAQALKMILLAAGYPEPAQSAPGTHWASGYLQQALTDGLTTINADQLDRRISRNAIAEIAAKALKLPLSTLTASPFTDLQMTDAAATYVLPLYEKGIIVGTEKPEGSGIVYFYGSNAIRRSEMAVIIWRINNYRSTGSVNG